MDAVTYDLDRYMEEQSEQDRAYEELQNEIEADLEKITEAVKHIKKLTEDKTRESGFDFEEDILSDLLETIREVF